MRTKRLRTVADVVSWRLCVGCGACVPACASGAIKLFDVLDRGLRPIIDESKCENCGQCLKVCPGVEISHKIFDNRTILELQQSWGPVLETWEGYSSDADIRYKGSSGGVATAVALFCLENEQVSGVLHIGAKPDAPLHNMPVISKNRQELLKYIGSRYSPAAPCEKLDWIRENDSPFVFVGKPCDVVALRKSQAVDPSLAKNISLAISIFCAGTPSTKGTENLLEALGVKTKEVMELRFRGCGWPGMTTVRIKGDTDRKFQMSYEESWGGILNKYVTLRCRLCPDGTGEFADISVGDPWYRKIEQGESGRSLVLVRTERGREVLRKAVKAGYLKLEEVEPEVVSASQKGLLDKRQKLFGRLLAMRVMLVPVPHFSGFSLCVNWARLSWVERIRSVLGTFRRIITRRWLMPARSIMVDVAKHSDSLAVYSMAGDSKIKKS